VRRRAHRQILPPVDGTAEMTLRHEHPSNREALDGHLYGCTGCFDALSALFARGPPG
jgi:hypothetical protein